MLMLDFNLCHLLRLVALNEVYRLSIISASSLQSFELFYEELPKTKRSTRIRRARVS